jgi:tRNA A22 N-methylase
MNMEKILMSKALIYEIIRVTQKSKEKRLEVC